LTLRTWLLYAYLIISAGISFMTNATQFTQESQLKTLLSSEISDFWQTGKFASFQGIDNKRVNYAAFITNNKASSLVISPGRSESYLKYKELAFDLSQLNINIFIIDHRGQGLSERLLDNPHKGFVNQFDDYADDLQTFINTIVTPHNLSGQKPLLLAHSMGGAIATRLLQKYPDSIKAALFSSPMIGINSGGLPEWLAKTLITSRGFFNKLFSDQAWYFISQDDYQAKTFEKNPLMHSNVRYQTFIDLYQQTPKLQLGGVTGHWLQQALLNQKTMFSEINKITTPILIMQAGDDTIVDNQAQNEFCSQLHKINSSLCSQGKPFIIENAYHELFFESDKYRNQALDFTLSWINKNR
jgi:lysophospholipase